MQNISQRAELRRAVEDWHASPSPQYGVVRDKSAIGNSPHFASEESSAVRSSYGTNYTDQNGRDAETMRRAQGIGTALIGGIAMWTILFFVLYLLWVYRP